MTLRTMLALAAVSAWTPAASAAARGREHLAPAPPYDPPPPPPPSATKALRSGEIVVMRPRRLGPTLQVLSRNESIYAGEWGVSPGIPGRRNRIWGGKPSMTQLRSGEVVLVYSCQESPECADGDPYNLKLRRSTDLGESWTEAVGSTTVAGDGEWSVHALADDTVILHDGSGDMYHSEDGGRSFANVSAPGAVEGRALPQKFFCYDECASWALIEIFANSSEAKAGWPEGVYYFTDNSIWRSVSSGRTWALYRKVSAAPGLQGLARRHGFFAQSGTPYIRRDGSMVHSARYPTNLTCDNLAASQLWHASASSQGATWTCGSTIERCVGGRHSCPYPCVNWTMPAALEEAVIYHMCPPHDPNAGDCANVTDGSTNCSVDAFPPRMWAKPECATGEHPKYLPPGNHYASMTRLRDGRLLQTWTHRSNFVDDDGYGAGMRAVISYDDARTFDMSSDYIVLSGGDDFYWPCANGCFCASGSYAGTLQLHDRSLLTVYGYSNNVPGAQFYELNQTSGIGALRWMLPPLNTPTWLTSTT
jgi:hypothetical protein